MEATRSTGRKVVVRALSLSIAALLFLVNARAEPLTTVNPTKAPAKSVKNSKGEFERLVQMLLDRGSDGSISGNLAPQIGLESASDIKKQDILVRKDGNSGEMKTCIVVFSDAERKSPMCLFIKRSEQTTSSIRSTYFKVNLFGKLEKAVKIHGKRTVDTAIRGSGVTTVQDIESPAVKKDFDGEMAYWKKWVKKEMKAPAKKDSASVTPTVGKTATAAL
ncbi:MAG: hypothetical protein M0D55_14180 [Elusimicrobiota bacterium]|nr:MAG: hypothetical protein M0D55_14180 [Elusimicrobiota bacterium]